MTTVHTLASGSSGNALLLSCDGTHLLMDAGISCRRITAALGQLGLTLEDLDAVFITHTHTDHIAGLRTMLRRSAFPLLATQRTCRELEYRLEAAADRLEPVALSRPVTVGECTVTAFSTSHDAPGCCGYRIDTADGSVGLLTDTGYVTEEAAEILPGADLVVLEANHDPDTLCSGPYPASLKRRILGDAGHLSNGEAARFAVALADSGASEIVLAHLSRENNTPAMALRAVETALSAAELAPRLSVAPRDSLSAPLTVCRRASCSG